MRAHRSRANGMIAAMYLAAAGALMGVCWGILIWAWNQPPQRAPSPCEIRATLANQEAGPDFPVPVEE